MLLIKNGRLHLESGEVCEGWDILVSQGIIQSIGKGLSSLEGKVIDADGLDVFPGIVLPICAIGAVGFANGLDRWDLNETSSPITPEAYIRDAFDLREQSLQRFTQMGITSYGLSPGVQNLISGQMALVHTAGDKRQDVFLRDRIALKGNFTDTVRDIHGMCGGPKTHMGMFAMLDEALYAASLAEEKLQNPGLMAMKKVVQGEIPFFLAANTQGEIESVLSLAEKYNLKLVLSNAFGMTDYCAKRVIDNGWHVCLGDGSNFMAATEYGGANYGDFVRWYRAGMKLSLFCNGDEGYAGGYEQLMWMAATMRKAGATADEVMDMLTAQPAEALGADDLVGSLCEGKLADIILCKGNLADRYDNYVTHTFLAGHLVYQRRQVL